MKFFLHFFNIIIIIIRDMAGLAPDGAVWGYFLSAGEMPKLHLLVKELRMPLFTRDDMVQMTFSQSFVTVLEVLAGDDVRLFDLS